MKVWQIAPWVLLLGACASVPLTTVGEQEITLNTKPVCCEDLQTLSYEPLPPKTPTVALLDSTAPVRLFPSGRSYFRAFRLPPGASQGVWIKSYFNGMFIKQYLQPVVMFLDKDYRPLVVAAPRTSFQDGNFFGDTKARMVGGTRVPAQAKFLVVFTAPISEGTGTVQIAPSTGVLMIGNTPAFVPVQGTSIQLERSLTGKLSLEIESLPE